MTDIKQEGNLYIIDEVNNTLTVDGANTRVGIGNNNPGHALSVTGDGNFTANLSAGSNLFLVDAGNSRITLGTTTAVSGNVLTVSGASNFSDTITAAGTGNSLTVSDTLRIAQTGSGLRMTNVGAFDNDGSNNFRIFGTNDLILAANGDTGTAITIDATNQDVTISNDLRVGTGAFYINSTQLTATATELNQLDGVTLGTAASANTGDFATAAQGTLADSATQPGDNISTLTNDSGFTTNTGTVTSVATGTGLTGGPITSTGTISLANTTVTAGSYTSADITVDAQGRITAASNGSGGGGISIGDSVGSGTSGSILFVDASTNLAQDNAELFWDDTNNRLGLGTSSPATTLHVDGTIRQTNSTSAVLVSDGNGDIGSASNLQDLPYLQTVGTFLPPAPPPIPTNLLPDAWSPMPANPVGWVEVDIGGALYYLPAYQ